MTILSLIMMRNSSVCQVAGCESEAHRRLLVRPSGTFLVSSGQSCKRAGQGLVDLEMAYDLSPGCPLRELEDLAELVLGFGGFGEHPAGLGAAAGRGVDQDCLFDAGELVEQVTDREV